VTYKRIITKWRNNILQLKYLA